MASHEFKFGNLVDYSYLGGIYQVLRSKARGNMFVQTVVETPVELTDKQKNLLRDFEKSVGGEAALAHALLDLIQQAFDEVGRHVLGGVDPV